MNKCVFLDRDGVLNEDRVDYAYRLEDFKIIEGAIDALKSLKQAGYFLIVITNQSGIAKGIYKKEDFFACMDEFHKQSGNILDAVYYSPHHEKYSSSLTRKPGSLLFEKAVAKFNVDISQSWMVGDRDRDLIPAKKIGLKTILITGNYEEIEADYKTTDLRGAAEYILQK